MVFNNLTIVFNQRPSMLNFIAGQALCVTVNNAIARKAAIFKYTPVAPSACNEFGIFRISLGTLSHFSCKN
jgi:hypothetical protein